MDRRRLIASGALGAAAATATLAAPHVANAQARVCRRIGEMTDGAFQIRPFAPGELVPALQVMDAVAQNSVECGYTAPYYYIGKDPSLVFGSCLPFGLNG